MKKILSLVLVVVMLMSMTVTAFAAEGEQSGTSTVTAVVPEPEYTIHFPADMTLEYGNGERQLVGEIFVTDAKYLAYTQDICVKITTAPLKSGDNEIPVVFEWKHTHDVGYDDDLVNWPGLYSQFDERYQTVELYATVTEADWKAAKPGTYTSTITYDFRIF